MALLPLLRYPDPRLHTVAQPVQAVDGRIRSLAMKVCDATREVTVVRSAK